jgi:hypothetical protein
VTFLATKYPLLTWRSKLTEMGSNGQKQTLFGPLMAQSRRFASEPEAVARDCAPDLNRLPTAGHLWCAYVAPRVSVDCHRRIAAAGRRAGCAGS